ncbi:sulfotransferase [Salinisphaera shabanensis]|jgi:tetratricopeptide (TPR) repeat protein|uniref:sulfotransferase n=1 Tax=Salinisphaera shabanensis TaxID=180542 RepID=UPI00333FA712
MSRHASPRARSGDGSRSSTTLAEAVALHRAGRLDAADACYRRIKRRDPDYAEALRLRALIAHRRRQPDAAIKLLRRATEHQPANPVHHHSLAELLRVSGDTRAAIAAYRRAFALQPERAANGLDLGDALAGAGFSDDALTVYADVVERHPAHIDAYLRSAALIYERGDPAGAAAQLSRAQAHVSDDADTQCALAAAWGGIEAHDRAAALYETVVAQAPDHARALAGLGSACQSRGQFAAAARHFEHALDRDPGLGWVYAALMNNRRYAMSADRIAAMQRQAADAAVGDTVRSHMHFALGHHYDANKAPDPAFAHFEAGNRLHAQRHRFAPQVFDDRIERIITQCDSRFFAERAGDASGWEQQSAQPIFIVGMPRSGTSLVEQIVASHPQAHGAGELNDIRRMVRELPAITGSDRPYPECMDRLTPAQADTLAGRYLGALAARAPEAARVTDKMPFNMLWLGLIARLFPNARVVYCRREAMDNCLSCYFQLFNQGMRFAYDQGHVGQVYRQHERLMAHWAAHLPLPMLTVDYEALVADPEAQSRRLIGFTGLDWDDRCLDFHRQARDVRTASVWQVRQPVYRSSVERWRAYAPWLGPLEAALGR